MPRRILFALAVCGASLLPGTQARAEDGLFGNLFSRVRGMEQPAIPASAETRDRDQVSRNLRRDYWELERARLARPGLAEPVPERTIAAR